LLAQRRIGVHVAPAAATIAAVATAAATRPSGQTPERGHRAVQEVAPEVLAALEVLHVSVTGLVLQIANVSLVLQPLSLLPSRLNGLRRRPLVAPATAKIIRH